MSKCFICGKTKKKIEMHPIEYDQGQLCRPCTVISWIEENIILSDGEWTGKNVQLMKWQKNFITAIFGDLDDLGLRKIRQAFLFIAKKNGKTDLAAFLVLYFLFADSEGSHYIVSAASDQQQAAMVFNQCTKYIKNNDLLLNACRIVENQKLIRRKNGNQYRAVSKDVPTAHGWNISFLVFDEVHTQTDYSLYTTLTQGSGAGRREPLHLFLTTAGWNKLTPCYDLYKYTKRWKDGTIKNERFYGVIYEMDEGDDPGLRETWKKANPSLGILVHEEELGVAYQQSQDMPMLENSFLRLRLNKWTQLESRFMPMEPWDNFCSGEPEIPEGSSVYLGVDLSSTRDLTAFVILYVDQSGDKEEWIYHFKPFIFMPGDESQKGTRQTEAPYIDWVNRGIIEVCPGPTISHQQIYERILEETKGLYVQSIGVDLSSAHWLVEELSNNYGADSVLAVKQTFLELSPYIKKMLKLVCEGRIRHGGHEAFRWMAGNAAVVEDRRNDLMLAKDKSTGRIDAVVAAVMALNRHDKSEPSGSVYDDHDLILI